MSSTSDTSPELSVVVPVYNEQASVIPFLEALIPCVESCTQSYEVVFVNDGSNDNTLPSLLALQNTYPCVKVVSFARNFGKDIALTAGLAYSTGNAVIPMDGDLQHPPSLIPHLVSEWKKGFQMVVAVRTRREEESWARRKAAHLFYSMIKKVSSVPVVENAGDFRLLDRKIVSVINRMPERCRFMKGIFAWPGFRTTHVGFEAAPRAHSTTRWNFWKLFNFALDGLFSFSSVPLRIWTYVGSFLAVSAFVFLTAELVKTCFFGVSVPGYPSLFAVVLFFNGVGLLSNGIQGEYIARIYDEVKNRPLYVVEGTWGFEKRKE